MHAQSYRRAHTLPTIEHLWVGLLLAGIVAAAGALPLAPWDFWWHAAVGREIVTTGRIPQIDHFSYTAAGRPYHYQSWLSEVLLYAVLSVGGPAGAIWLRVGLLLLLFIILLRVSAWASGGRLRVAAIACGVTAVGSATNWAIRPQLFALPLFAIEYALLWRWRSTMTSDQDSPTPLWPLPLLVALWANLHGSFALGLALPGLLWLGEALQARTLSPALRRLGGWTLLAALAILLNPRGPGILGYVWTLLTDPPSQTFIIEWRPPTLATGDGRLFFATIVGSALLFLWQRHALRLSDWLWWIAFALLAARGIRYVIWFFLLLAPLLALALGAVLTSKRRTSPARRTERPLGEKPAQGSAVTALNATLLGLFGLLALLMTPAWKMHLPLPPALQGLVTANTPVTAVAVLEQNPPRRLFHDMGYGSYLIWQWGGNPPVFIDPRVELYPLAHWNDYATVTAAAPGWQAVLDHWRVDTLLLDRTNQAALVDAAAAAGWRERWHDDHSIIFDRKVDP